MPENDKPNMAPGDFAEALALLTRLPVRTEPTRRANAAWAWPLAGVPVALPAGLAAVLALWLGLSAAVAAGLALAVQIAATGALHEDGLADCADGFWGGLDRARRLEIMHDSRIGTYGVLALALALGLRWALLAGLFAADHVFAPLLAAAALSRAPMAVLMHALPGARPDGLSASTGRPSQDAATLAVVVALLAGLLSTGLAALLAALLAGLTSWAVAALARSRIGGQTGDVLGASQQLAEIGALAGLAISMAG